MGLKRGLGPNESRRIVLPINHPFELPPSLRSDDVS